MIFVKNGIRYIFLKSIQMAVHCVCWSSVGKTIGIHLYIVQENCAACVRTHWKIPLDLLENVEKFHLG
jgi:predicted ABC-type sugar transport system permease subunit